MLCSIRRNQRDVKNKKKASVTCISDSFQFHWMCNSFLVDFCAFVYKYEVHYCQKGKCSIVPAVNLAHVVISKYLSRIFH